MDATVTGGNITLLLKRSGRARAPYYLMGCPPATALTEFFSFGPNNAERSGSVRSCISRRNTPKQARRQMSDHPSSITHGRRRERLRGDTVAASGRCAAAAVHLMQPIKVIPPTGAELGNRIISLRAHLCPSVWTLRRFYGCFLHISRKLTDTEQMQLHRGRP